jgi:hypothetical protein
VIAASRGPGTCFNGWKCTLYRMIDSRLVRRVSSRAELRCSPGSKKSIERHRVLALLSAITNFRLPAISRPQARHSLFPTSYRELNSLVIWCTSCCYFPSRRPQKETKGSKRGCWVALAVTDVGSVPSNWVHLEPRRYHCKSHFQRDTPGQYEGISNKMRSKVSLKEFSTRLGSTE